MGTATLAIVATILFFSSILQRVSGMGFALLSAPFLILILGATNGIFIINVTAGLVSLFMTVQLLKNVSFKLFFKLSIFGLLGIGITYFLIKDLSGPILLVLSGIFLLILSLSSILFNVKERKPLGLDLSYLAGFFSGVSNFAAGTGGIVLSTYAIFSGINYRTFVATIQPYFVMNATAAALFRFFNAEKLGLTTPIFYEWVVMVAVMIVGLYVGAILTRKINDEISKKIMLAITFIGSISVLFRGISLM